MHENKEAYNQQEPKQCNKQEPDSGKPIAACREPVYDFDGLVEEIKRLVGLFSLEDVKKALAMVDGAESKKQSTD